MRTLLCFLFTLCGIPLLSQAPARVTPVVPYGGIYDIPEATVRPDSSLDYRIVVDVVSGATEPDSLGAGLYNVARFLNLLSVGGVPEERVQVVLAIHGGATVGVLDDAHYRERFGTDNPNLPLIRSLHDAGVTLTVCGQSLLSRDVPVDAVTPEVAIATSMLTTVATYQLRGYAIFRF